MCHPRIASARRRRLQVRPPGSAPRAGGPSPPLSRSSPQLNPHKTRPGAHTPQTRRSPDRRAPTAPRSHMGREKPPRTAAPAPEGTPTAPSRPARPVRASTRGPRSPPALGAPKRALRRRRRARPALTAAAASRGPQQPSSSSTTQPTAGLRLRRRRSILPPAQELRERPCGAGIPGGAARLLQASPAGRPDASARPSAALARFSRLKSSRDYFAPAIFIRTPRRARGVRVRAGLGADSHGRAAPPHRSPSPPGAGLLAAARARARLSPPHTSTQRAQPPDPALFSAAEAARGAGGGAALAAAGRTSGGAVRLSRAATLPGPALPSPPLRCGASAQTAQTFSVRAGGGPGGGGPRSRTVQ